MRRAPAQFFKPLFGSQGKGLSPVDGASDLPAPEAADDIYYLQDFVPPAGPKISRTGACS